MKRAMDEEEVGITNIQREESLRMERRLNKYAKLAKRRRLKKRSVRITETQQQTVSSPESGSKEEAVVGSITKTQDQQTVWSESQSQKTTTTKKKKKLVRLDREANDFVVAMHHSRRPHPRIPDWKLAMKSKATQELYRDSLAYAEKIEKEDQDMYEQVFRKGYIELEVTDDDDDDAED